ncbi:large conductance mechanosensitive channel protein MscL [Polluticoccus soli]|uniref:large conductance mechanosensitive channel protein MscL n=1 Tax=Polluticoccus soli TaxID=3034150 RepID=UPI0023E2A918|nr:large conductance mechanosensitive channel protein MscL [Flavipsychrobacter sp. JY13-12]
MGFWSEFRQFAVKGNVLDLAVGVIIGAAFGKIVTAMVDDVIMPLIAAATKSDMNVADKFIVLSPGKDGDVYASLEKAKAAGANVFAWGHFVQTIVDFLIIAFFIFVAIRTLNKLKTQQVVEAVPPGPSSTDKLLMEIRDLLKQDK